jgi:hypothetical protein
MSAIEITHRDLSISELRAEAARTADAKQARRILAIASNSRERTVVNVPPLRKNHLLLYVHIFDL